VLERLGTPGPSGSAAALAALAEVMREATLARRGSFLRSLYRGGLASKLLDDRSVDAAAARAHGRARETPREPAGVPSTTHISVVDGAGNAASLSASTGCGSGVIVPGTGIHVNNMLGETDLNISERSVGAGRRLTSMMAPSVVLAEGHPRLVVGSAGSIRLRAAILQIVVNVVAHGMRVEDAIAAPRIHLEGDLLNVEGGFEPEIADQLEERGYDVVRWTDRNLYFGGASAVAWNDEGELEAAGDPRRGGAGVIVR
jgi:gamma-glutamyltranspeptidase/glutathione hydrolase